MRSVSKSQLPAIIGKTSFWNPKKVVNAGEYIAGIEEIDNAVGQENFFKIRPIINFQQYAQGIEISVMHKFKMHRFGLPLSAIKSITIERGGVIEVQERSVIGRAVVGGLLLGPLGAVVGGVSGLKDNVAKEEDKIIFIIELGGVEQALLFAIKKGKTKEVNDFFKNYYGNLYSFHQ